jgi:RNA polymerase sigma-70 factor (ECF subfamily)
MDAEFEETRRLVEAARAGRREAYERLFATYRAELEREIGRHPALPGPDRSDLVQDALVDAVRAFERFEPRGPGSFGRWLAKILQNRVRASRRERRRDKRDVRREVRAEALAATSEPEVLPAASITSPSGGAARREENEQVLRALEHLAPDHREVIRLVKLEELSIDEVAARMGRSANAVKKLLARALVELRGVLGKAAGEDVT